MRFHSRKTTEERIAKGKEIKQTQKKLNHGKHQITKIKEANETFIIVQDQQLERFKKYYEKFYQSHSRSIVSTLNPIEDQTSIPPITKSKIKFAILK